jgi:hypothetical protein
MFTTLKRGHLNLPCREGIRVLAAALARPGLAMRFLRAGRIIEAAMRLYEDYPATPAKLESWMGHTEFHARAMARLTAGSRR